MSAKDAADLSLNCVVRIKSENFENCVGYIHSLRAEDRLATVLVTINGRGAPVEVQFSQLERIDEPPGFERADLPCKQ